MIVSLSPTQPEIMRALRVNLLQQVLPQGSAMFSGSISGTTLTVTKLAVGLLADGDAVFGADVSPETEVVTQLSGPTGGVGTYQITVSQDVSGVPLNAGVPVIQAQGNRVAQPPAQDFVIMTPLRKPRLATNIDRYVDCYFQASLVGNALVVTEVAFGLVQVGAQLFGVGVAPNTVIDGGPDDGLPGIYSVSVSQTVSAEGMACGTASLLQKTEQVIQLDFYGPKAADYAQVVSTVFRDEVGVTLLAASGLPVSPLYADGPSQGPFVDGEQQYENRWRLEAHLQADQTVVVPQQFAGALAVDLIEVEATYPP